MTRNVRHFSRGKVTFRARTPLRRGITGLIAVAILGVVSCAGQGQDATNAPQTDINGVAVTAGAIRPRRSQRVDLHFVAMITPHRQQAEDMSEIVLTADGTSATTEDLADRVKVGQQEETNIRVGGANWKHLRAMRPTPGFSS